MVSDTKTHHPSAFGAFRAYDLYGNGVSTNRADVCSVGRNGFSDRPGRPEKVKM